MAIDFDDPDIVAQEIERSERRTNASVDAVETLVQGYHNKFYRDDREPLHDTPENAAYEYVALMMPMLAYDNPSVQVEARRVGVDPQTAAGMEDALNGWITEFDLQTLFELAALDFLFNFGVLLTTFEPYGGSDDQNMPSLMAPRVHYVTPRRFFLDANAVAPVLDGEGYDAIQFMGHKCVRSREAMLRTGDFDKTMLKELASDFDLRSLGRPTNDESPTRDEITYYEIWQPPESYDPDAEYNGMIYTMACGQDTKNKKWKGRYLREPRPFYGPAWGPYTMFGAYPVSGEAFPLAPIMATASQAEEVNDHANAAARAAKREKSLTLVDAGNPSAAKAVKDGRDGEVYKVSNLGQNTVQQVEIGGVSDQRYQYLQAMRERLDRNSGVNDARRGNIVRNTLATAIDTANASNSARDAFLQKKFARGVVQVLKTAAWYFTQSPNVIRPLSPIAAKRMGMNRPVFLGGPQPGQAGQSPSDLSLTITPYSMERPNEAELRQITMQLVEWLTGMAPTMPQLPWIDFKEMFDVVAKVFNQRGLTRLFLPDRLDQIRQMMAQAAQGGGKPEKPPKQPSESLNYKDAPPDIQRQIEAQAGLTPSRIGVTNDQALEAVNSNLHHHAAGRMPPPTAPVAPQAAVAGGGAA